MPPAVKLKRDPQELFHQLNERYFDGALPASTKVRYVDYPGTGEIIITKTEDAATGIMPDGTYLIELHGALKTAGRCSSALALAHEMVHVKHPKKAKRHNAKVWEEEYQRLVGLGFFREIF